MPPHTESTPVQEVIWTRPARGARGPRPGCTREQIATAAVRIADGEGLDATSIRRVATEVGVSATALYRYVARKDELFDLMVDAVHGEQQPPPLTGDWRTDLRVLADTSRAAALRHPWLPILAAGRPCLGPHSLRWLEFAFGAFTGHDLDADEELANVETLSAFVSGHVLSQLAETQATSRTGQSRDEWMAAQGAYGDSIITGGRYPRLAHIMREAQGPHARDRLDRSFTMGVDRILDGLATRMTRRTAAEREGTGPTPKGRE